MKLSNPNAAVTSWKPTTFSRISKQKNRIVRLDQFTKTRAVIKHASLVFARYRMPRHRYSHYYTFCFL
ncbi:hypothetical protein HanXRQr2_Chr05g0225941 [Helianthus annuus]|uniref:Uncharacterized protein n=1 Tax=Helianthus annuus TaxID=4232 RepID=A0A9K3NNG4_HELAN|nr:hypothetical protein HanXRQr2_Chr05g0225941 [Helianthus annuus]